MVKETAEAETIHRPLRQYIIVRIRPIRNPKIRFRPRFCSDYVSILQSDFFLRKVGVGLRGGDEPTLIHFDSDFDAWL